MASMQKTMRRFASVATMAVCFAASSAFAAMLATNDFETSFADFTTDETLAALAAYNGDAPSDAASYPFGSFGDKYLSVDTDDATIWRSFAVRSANVYFDSYVKFTPMYDEFAYAEDAKFVIYLDSATSNLCVISGTAANDRTPVTNRLTSATVLPNTWGRLTVNANVSGGVFAFQVKLNGTLLTAAGPTDTFYSLTAGTTLSEFGISGTGALDNFAVRTTDPLFSGTVAATIGGADGEKYATLEAALAEADADTVVSLAADHAGKVYLADAATYKIAPGAYSFGGVVGANGYKVTAGEPALGVTTYTATDAFASQPSPVALWDGASENYDFNTLTRTVGANTYTLNLNEQNTVGGDGAYVQIGPNNAQKAVTLTAANANGFGTAGAVTVIMKCSSLNLTDNTYRGLIGLISDEGGYYSGDNNVKIAVATGFNTDNGAGAYSYYIANGVYNSNSQNVSAYVTGEQTICLTYSSASGTCIYRNGSLIASSSGLKYGSWLSPVGIALGGMDLDGSSRVYAQTGMKISAVAVFTSTLTAEQVAAFTFPSSRIAEDIAVSEINGIFGGESEIWLDVADGVTITGDTTFNATTVHFASAGEVVVYPPASNAATFDFSGVAKPVVEYATQPTQSGDVFTSTTVPTWLTDSTRWTGTICLNGAAVTDFTSNIYGNDSSLVRLKNVSGWLRAPDNSAFTNTVPVELVGTLTINNGNSANDGNPNRCSVFRKLSGSGGISANSTANKTVVVIQDSSEFTGGIGLNEGKIIVFGETMPAYEKLAIATIFVMEGTSVTANGFWWATGGKIFVDGELRAPNLDRFGGGTYITTSDIGKFTLTSSDNVTDEVSTDFKRIDGTGTLRYESSGSYYRALSQNNFPTNMTLEVELGNGLIVPNAGVVNTIGSLSGTKNIRSDWNSGNRDLRILQAKDTTWEGVFANDDRIANVLVAPGVSSAGVLTLSGTQTHNNNLVVESGAKVNLTGTWVGPVTVNGTLGGTGTITGNLTLANGATLKGNVATVTGTVTATGAIALELPTGALDGGTCTILSASGAIDISGATFTATVGGSPVDMARYEVKAVNGSLVLQLIPVKRGTGLLLF